MLYNIIENLECQIALNNTFLSFTECHDLEKKNSIYPIIEGKMILG